MKKIEAKVKTIREVLDKVKYKLDYFQREYRWGKKHIEQLITDLTEKFLDNYDSTHERREVQNYDKYYLGSIILNESNGNSIIDGQQRLTSITLLLIYLNNLQRDKETKVLLNDLIFSEKYGEKSFNLDIPERLQCIKALYEGNINGFNNFVSDNESVKNIINRYNDIQELFPEELKNDPLSYFIDWLIDNVFFVQITTTTDEDAYTIFETMNDRGLNLTPTEMLKGYILSNVNEKKDELNKKWNEEILKLKNISKEEDLEFFKAWLRAKYAESIRPGRKGAENEDFEKIGTRFHLWFKENKEKIGLNKSEHFYDLVNRQLPFYINIYLLIKDAATNFNPKYENIFYINYRGLATSIFYPLLIAPITLNDSQDTIDKKLNLVSKYLEMFIVFRSVNYRNYSHSSIRYTMYSFVKEIRNKDLGELSKILKEKAIQMEWKLDGTKNLGMHGQNRRFIHFLLARITTHIEQKSGRVSNFYDYIRKDIEKPFQVEHIWSDSFDEHRDEFDQRDEFDRYRNKLGALLLLQEGFNQSLGNLSYGEKLPHYYGQNLLAQTLSPQCYQKNPRFLRYKRNSGLPFKPHEQFKKKDIDERQELYQKILEEIYNFNVYDEVIKE